MAGHGGAARNHGLGSRSVSDITLLHDDSTQLEWSPHLRGRRIKAIVTDPPYGIKYQSRRGQTHSHDKLAQPIASDADVDGAAQAFLDAVRPLCDHTADQCELYVFTRWDIIADWVEVIGELGMWGFTYKALLVWDKGGLGMGDIDASWCPSFELVLYAKKGRRDLNFQRESVLRFDRPSPGERIHPTEKPVALLEEIIKISTDRGDLVVDPFAGSASTLKAAKNTGRQALGVEKKQSYFDQASQRLQQELFF